MSNLVLVTGDFCSGSTLLFTLFRKTEHYCCLFEPLHSKLREYLICDARPQPQDHHFFVENGYYGEFRGFNRAAALFNPDWGASNLFLPEDAPAADLYRYFSYLIGMGFTRSPRVLLKENRMPFRLAWFRKNFPQARVVHIYRRREEQWKSVVNRVQGSLGRADVGQDSVDFAGFSVAAWCNDLAPHFPELAAVQSSSGADRFAKLWQLSYEANRSLADISIGYHELLGDFASTWTRIMRAIDMPPIDVAQLQQFVVTPDQRATLVRDSQPDSIAVLGDELRRKYARLRVRMQDQWRSSAHH
jgi:hypothetical protein